MPDPSEDRMRQMLSEIKDRLGKSADEIVPWFFAVMPEYYFFSHSRDEQVRHLHTIISGQVTTEKQTMVLTSPCGTKLTYITPGGGMDSLIGVLTQVRDKNIHTARLYSTTDNALRLDAFLLAPQAVCDPEGDPYREALDLMRGKTAVPGEIWDDFSGFLTGSSEDYVQKFDPSRTMRHYDIYRRIKGTERVHVNLESQAVPCHDRMVLAMTDPPGRRLLLAVVKILARHGVEVCRGYADSFQVGGGSMGVISLYVNYENMVIEPHSDFWAGLRRELSMVKWMEIHGLERLADEEGFSVREVMLMQAACEFAHQFLLKTNLYAFPSDKIARTVLRYRRAARALIEYFKARFDPGIPSRADAAAHAEEKARAEISEISDWLDRAVFDMIYKFFRYTLRTNYFLETRFGLAFRMDPTMLDLPDGEEPPYGFFFFHGPYFLGFHVRFRDMARGGVRVVRTRTQEQFELESNRLFDEVMNLARAQQYKNKDIPEGGSKAVLLLGPEADVDTCVKSMANSLLDVILTSGEGFSLPGVVDYLNHEEIIYLGPDENITPEHIEWIVERGKKRGYKWPNSLMSSKPKTGINHKEYGVTSEGVVVYVEEVLRSLGIDPEKQAFTVKMTGGPKGDVAGNAMKIMFRKFGDNARILAVADGHGAAFDPDGLDHAELTRLIKAEKSSSAFDPARLTGSGAFVVSTDEPEGARLRDELHNKVAADVFIPAGGRPDTINIGNWEKFLTREGKPSAKAVIEGANIFITQEARSRLEDAGCLIVRDSTANKTGVICSSYEVLAGLVLSDEEFLADKQRYVGEVLEILRARARQEARLLLREYRYGGKKRRLTDISLKISKEINRVSDMIFAALLESGAEICDEQDLADMLLAYCPGVLVEKYPDRVRERVPDKHKKALLAKFIASRIVYTEGLTWLREMSQVCEVTEVIRSYLEQEKKVAAYLAELRGSDLADRDQVVKVLDAAGRKYFTAEDLGLE